MSTSELLPECSICGYECAEDRLLAIHVEPRSPLAKQGIEFIQVCALCRHTYAFNAYVWIGQYPPSVLPILRSLNYIGNEIIERLDEIGNKLLGPAGG